MRIERKEHALDGRLGRLFVIDLAGISVFDRGDGFVIIGFNLVRLVSFFRDLPGVGIDHVAPETARFDPACDARLDDDKSGDDGELACHSQLPWGMQKIYHRARVALKHHDAWVVSELCVARQISLAQPFTAGLALDVKSEAPLMGLFLSISSGTQA